MLIVGIASFETYVFLNRYTIIIILIFITGRKIPALRKKKRKPDHYMDGETNVIDISNGEETETVFNS